MTRENLQLEIHLCPDCQTNHARGQDRFRQPMPCPACVVARLLKALHADLDVQSRTRGMRRLKLSPVFLEKFWQTGSVAAEALGPI